MRVALVHNGIIENYESLREMLRGKGYEFVSQTDTEVIAHLIHSMYRGDLFQTVREAVKQLHGAYAIAVMHKDQPHTVVGARQGSPLVVGRGRGRELPRLRCARARGQHRPLRVPRRRRRRANRRSTA